MKSHYNDGLPEMNKCNITMWVGTSAHPAAKLRVSVIASNGHYNNLCRLTCGGKLVCLAPEGEPLVAYAEKEFGATDGKWTD
jgi:hypothetical protein